MLHSHETLDRAGGFSRINLIAPLRHRDFGLLWSGMTISLLGDGIFLVAMAWQAYELWDAPAALSLLGIGMTIPTIAFLLPAGVLSDRLDRRRLVLCSDVARAVVVGALAALVLAGALAFWHLVVLVALYGVGSAFFTPAFEALVPDIVPPSELAAANALDQFVRPMMLRLIGPALGGVLVAALGTGAAFAVDAASFLVAVVAVWFMRPRAHVRSEHIGSSIGAVGEGLRFVRRRVWLWGTLGSAALASLLFMGPAEVLLPYVVKNELGGSARDLGLVFAAGGIGAIFAALVMGQRGQPRRDVTVMYVTWTLATLAVAGYGLATSSWQLAVACLVFNALETVGTIVWATIKQRHVPESLLGRVSSLDWLISIGLLPLSFALTAPAAALFGTRATLVGAALIGGAVTLGALFLPGMRDIERTSPGRHRARAETMPSAPPGPRPRRDGGGGHARGRRRSAGAAS